MAYRLEFYRTPSRKEPVLDHIRTQITAHRAKIGRALQYLEDTGHQARRPQIDYLGDDIYEPRVAIDQHQHRLPYFFHGRSIIVVAIGILKNEGRVPPSAIARARKAHADWLERFGGET